MRWMLMALALAGCAEDDDPTRAGDCPPVAVYALDYATCQGDPQAAPTDGLMLPVEGEACARDVVVYGTSDEYGSDTYARRWWFGTGGVYLMVDGESPDVHHGAIAEWETAPTEASDLPDLVVSAPAESVYGLDDAAPCPDGGGGLVWMAVH